MALLINKNINILGGITINQIYLRLEYFVDLSGKIISCNVNPYFNKDSYLNSPRENVINIPEIPLTYNLHYDSSYGDILTFLHISVKTDLSTDVFKNVTTLDLSTNSYVTNSVLAKPKFVDVTNINFVDL